MRAAAGAGCGIALAMAAVMPATAQNKSPERPPAHSGGGPSLPSRTAPMTITSARLSIHDAERRATFEGAVVVNQGDLTLKADRVDVWTNDSPVTSAGPVYGGSNVSRIVATGHVEVSQGDRVVQADEAVYDQARQQIELTGNLSGREGGYKVAGTRMVVFLLEHRSVIDQSRVVIPPQALSAPTRDGKGP